MCCFFSGGCCVSMAFAAAVGGVGMATVGIVLQSHPQPCEPVSLLRLFAGVVTGVLVLVSCRAEKGFWEDSSDSESAVALEAFLFIFGRYERV